MRFAIEGVDAKSGYDRQIELDAVDETAAALQAKASGVLPTEIKPIEPPIHKEECRARLISVGLVASAIVGVILAYLVSPYFWWLAAPGLFWCGLLALVWLASIEANKPEFIANQSQEAQARAAELEKALNIIFPHCQEAGSQQESPSDGIDSGKLLMYREFFARQRETVKKIYQRSYFWPGFRKP